MEQIVRELLVDLREHLDDELGNEIWNHSECPGKSREQMRKSVGPEGRRYIRPLEKLITRINMALADNAGAEI